MTTDKVVMLRAVEAFEAETKGIDPEMLLTLDHFLEVMQYHKAKSFAAVAVTHDGEVINTWFTTASPLTMLGSIELLKAEFLQSQMDEFDDD